MRYLIIAVSLLFVFPYLTDAQAGPAALWHYRLQAPNSIQGDMTLSVEKSASGRAIDATTTLKQGAETITAINSDLQSNENGSTIVYTQHGTGIGGAYRLTIRVHGRNITGSIDKDGHVQALHAQISGANPSVYILGNNLLNSLQAMLFGLDGDHPADERIFMPLTDHWFSAVLTPGKAKHWYHGAQPLRAIPVQVRLNGRLLLTLWCTPKRHDLLAMNQGPISVMRDGFKAPSAPVKPRTRLQVFFSSRANQVQLIHLHQLALGRSMRGVLSLPRTRKLRGAILLIPGSGPTDANGNNPLLPRDYIYKQLAFDLAARGYAMVRYDKPSISPTVEKHPPLLTLRGYAEAAAVWFSWMSKQNAFHHLPLVLMGHSEGGLIAPYAVSHGLISPARMVLLEAPGAPLAKILATQMADQASLRGASAARINSIQTDANRLNHYILEAKGTTLRLPAGFLKNFPVAHLFCQQRALPLFKSEFAADPTALMKTIRVPTLIIQGGNDIQVLPWNGRSLENANAINATLRVIPTMSHMLTAVHTKPEMLNPAPAGKRLDPVMISAVVAYLKSAG